MRDAFLFAYYRACGGRADRYAAFQRRVLGQPEAPTRRYTEPALRLQVAQLVPEFEDRAARSPAWLSAGTLATLERAVKIAAGKKAAARKPETIRKYEQRLFYATARRDAFKLVLLDTQPNTTVRTKNRRAPGVAQKLAKARLALKYAERAEPMRVQVAIAATERADRAHARYELAFAHMVNVRDWEQRTLMERRISNPKARQQRGVHESVDAARTELREARAVHLECRRVAKKAREALARTRGRIRTLRHRIAEMEKY